ncbi:MAG: YbhN family protein [Christensenellaceae bacterium]
MKQKKSMAPKIIYFAIISIAVIIVVFSVGDIGQIMNAVKNAKPQWVIATVGVLLAYILLNQLPLFILGRADNKKLKFSDALMIGTTEYFFNGITPFASGGQPFQIYSFSRIGVRASKGTGVVLINYVCYQTSIVLFCLLSLIFYPRISTIPGIKVIIAVGIIINVLVLAVFLGIGFSATTRRILEKIVYWFLSWKIFKGRFENKKVTFDNYCRDVQASVKGVFEYKFRFFVSLVLKFLSLVLYFAIPFFILKALNVQISYAEIPFICAMTTFAIAMSCFIPTPGSSGGIEFAFNTLFSAIPGVTDVAFAGMILWRFFTYYLLMVVSFIVYLIFERRLQSAPRFDEGSDKDSSTPERTE